MRLIIITLILLPVLSFGQDSIAPDHSNISTLSAAEFVRGMRVGWNVGNSLEAGDNSSGTFIPNETAWGNPKITQQLIDSLKAAGFNAIRLPVAWSDFSDATNFIIKKERLDRVQEVVNYAISRGMYVVMNEHWDGGWLQPTNAAKETAAKRLIAIWKQVAIRFRDFGDHLLFAGTNEVMKEGDYGTPTTEYINAQSGYNQAFVSTVRATGGRNAYRFLVVQAFNTNIDHAVSFFKLPADQTQNRLVLEVHYYDPYEFTIASDKTNITQWGANGSPPRKASWDSDESHVDAQFAKMKTNFIDKGIPVILGEYAAMLKNTTDNPPFRLAWDKYVTQAAAKIGMIPFYWDPGSLSTNSSGLFDRNTGKQGYPDVIAAIVSATPPVSVLPCAACIAMSVSGQSTMTIDVDKATTVIPNEIFGVLMERLGKQWSGGVWVETGSSIPNTNGMRNDVIDGLKECGVGAIEWPGGCAANDYDWSTSKNPLNDVGTDRFMQLCGLVGCEPVICGPGQSSSASSNLAWVTYINNNSAHPEWTLKYFKIGNEVWGCGGNQTVNTYMSNYTANYNKLKDPVNGKKLTLIAGSDQEGNWNWLGTMLNDIGNTIDAVEYHDYIYYPDAISSTNPTTANYWTIMKDVLTGDIHSHLYNNVFPAMNSYDPNKRIKIALDEWGDWLKDTGDGWMQQITLMDALSAGSHLNMFVQNADRIGVACLAQGVNVIHSLLNINPSKVMQKTTTFYVFKMFKPHHTNNAKVAPVTASEIEAVSGGGTNLPAVNAAASVDANGFVNISFVNVDLTTVRRVTAALTSSKASYTVESADVITGPAHTSFNDFGATEQVNIKTLDASNYSINGKTLTTMLPAMSVVMFRLAPPGTALQHGSFQKNCAEEFSISSLGNGGLLIFSLVQHETAATISIYGIDGRILADGIEKTFRPGKSCQVIGRNIGKGVYIVKIASKDFDLTKKLVNTR